MSRSEGGVAQLDAFLQKHLPEVTSHLVRLDAACDEERRRRGDAVFRRSVADDAVFARVFAGGDVARVGFASRRPGATVVRLLRGDGSRAERAERADGEGFLAGDADPAECLDSVDGDDSSDGGRDSLQGAEGERRGEFAVVAATASGGVACGWCEAGDSLAFAIRAVCDVFYWLFIFSQEVNMSFYPFVLFALNKHF